MDGLINGYIIVKWMDRQWMNGYIERYALEVIWQLKKEVGCMEHGQCGGINQFGSVVHSEQIDCCSLDTVAQ